MFWNDPRLTCSRQLPQQSVDFTCVATRLIRHNRNKHSLLIFRRFLDMIDGEYYARTVLRFQFQPKLLLNRIEEGRPGEFRQGSAADNLRMVSRLLKHGTLALGPYLPFQCEIMVAREPCVVYYAAVQDVFRQQPQQFRHRQPLTY